MREFVIGTDISKDEIEDALKFCSLNGVSLVETVANGKRVYRLSSQVSDEERATSCRLFRNVLLAKYDFTQCADSPFSDEERKQYAAYRDYLRNITEAEAFPSIYPKDFETFMKGAENG